MKSRSSRNSRLNSSFTTSMNIDQKLIPVPLFKNRSRFYKSIDLINDKSFNEDSYIRHGSLDPMRRSIFDEEGREPKSRNPPFNSFKVNCSQSKITPQYSNG